MFAGFVLEITVSNHFQTKAAFLRITSTFPSEGLLNSELVILVESDSRKGGLASNFGNEFLTPFKSGNPKRKSNWQTVKTTCY